jgi:hypothetical protein
MWWRGTRAYPLIHPSAWKRNSPKFDVAIWKALASFRMRTRVRFMPAGAKTRTVALFVARNRSKRLRLATVGLPENYGKSARCAHYSQNKLPTTVTTLPPPLPPRRNNDRRGSPVCSVVASLGGL